MKRYKNIGLKLTPQRLAILGFLEGNKDHPSADDIYREVLLSFPTMSFATVYNTLEALRQRGRLLELTIDSEKKRFDPNPEPHHHLICIKCKKVVDINETYELKVSNSDRKDFELLGNHIEFYGICPECKAKSSVTNANEKGGEGMAVFKCAKCGATKEGRCKPQACPKCGEKGAMSKA